MAKAKYYPFEFDFPNINKVLILQKGSDNYKRPSFVRGQHLASLV